MDGRRFDQLAKAIAGEAGSRRKVLGLGAGSVIAALLGFFGMGEEPAAARHTRRHGDRDRDRRRGERRMRICHCKNDNPNDCNSVRFSRKKAKRHLRRHKNDYKGKCNKDGGCNDVGNTCAIANPEACCADKCCSVNGSATSGICPSENATCCTQRQAGGYCSARFPQCCGEATCCTADQVCCPTSGGGRCCGAGQTCGLNSCQNAQGASVEAQPAGRREGR
jgi:hypothetical protein